MQDYIVSARKYRPSTFESVVGQKALTQTLKNAIENNKLAHAYLFCGPRGVGKTTCARIFAKTINCLHPSKDGEACNECESCLAFNEQRSYNIHELDAASNNSIEDIRQLIEQVRIPPQIGQYKVYIIDEVHMLSTAAFNAFLKTLEEPPHHAIFILATTEKHKILPTILSRCQIYDFNRINVEDTIEHLAYVAKSENVNAEHEALNVIALKADGGMRDALSIFDQVVSFTEGNITYKSVIENLNVLDYEYYFKLTNSFLGGDVKNALLILNDILNKGFDGNHFITGLASHFRDLLVSKDQATIPLLQVGASIKENYVNQASKCDPNLLFKAIKLCNDCDLNYKTSKNKRLLVELTLIQLCQLNQTDGNDSLAEKKNESLKPVFSNLSEQNKDNIVQSSNPSKTNQKSNESKNSNTKSTSAVLDHLIPKKKESQPSRSKIPVVSKSDLRKNLSLKGSLSSARSEKNQTTTTISNSSQAKKNAQPFNKEDLERNWIEFCNSLPIEEKANKQRMLNMRPDVTGQTTFKIVVDNDYLKKDMLNMRPKILKVLRNRLSNDYIDMNVEVNQDKEQNRAYNKKERYALMSKKNPSLNTLISKFNLEIF